MKLPKQSVSKDIEDRRAADPSSLGERVKRGIGNAKANIGLVKEELGVDTMGGSLKGFERAKRDLGGKRTPPHK